MVDSAPQWQWRHALGGTRPAAPQTARRPGNPARADVAPGRAASSPRRALGTLLSCALLATAALPGLAVAAPANAAPVSGSAGSTFTGASTGVATGVATGTSAGVQQTTSPTETSTGLPAEVVLESMTPVAPTEGDTIIISGRVVNPGSSTLRDVNLGVRIGRGGPFGSRSEIAAVGERTSLVPGDGERVDGVQATTADVPPGGSVQFQLTVAADTLGVGENGVYQFSVDAMGQTSERPWAQVLGIARTFLPWFPEPTDIEPTRLTVLWPLVEEPALTGRTLDDAAQTPLLPDDELAAEVYDGGRLETLVELGSDLPVSWVVDPALLDAVDAMTRPYRVEDGSASPPTDSPTPSDSASPSPDGPTDSDEAADDESQDTPGDGDGDDADASPSGDPDEAGGSEEPSGEPAGDTGDAEETTEPSATPTVPEGPGSVGTGGPAARAWLDALRTATQGEDGDDLVSLPYGDTDLASLSRAGSVAPRLADELAEAVSMGADTTERVIGEGALTEVAWPAEGAADPAIVETARTTGANALLLSGNSVTGGESLNRTPDTVRRLSDDTTALVSDPAVDALFTADFTGADGQSRATLAVQEFLAQTLLITMEAPSAQRGLTVMPPREMTTTTAQALHRAVSAALERGWVEGTGVSDALGNEPTEGAPSTVPPAEDYPEQTAARDLPVGNLDTTADLDASLSQFADVLTQPDRVVEPFTPAVLLSLSNAWRGRPEEQEEYLTVVNGELDGLRSLIDIPPKEDVTLSGRSATIPITVINDLQQPVQGLELRLTSSQPTRVTLTPDTAQVEVAAGSREQRRFTVDAKANGRVWVTAQLYTADGRPYGDPLRFEVNVTTIGNNVLLVLGTGLLLVTLAVFRMYVKRSRAHRAAGAGAEGGTIEVEEETPEGAGEGASPVEDTRPDDSSEDGSATARPTEEPPGEDGAQGGRDGKGGGSAG
ncbi:DUF6049 family protein [Allostreptomyces psammosilenae]|uniref:Uncharacterized protein n=1 Tax=Allostreptomyces psammosilenae TaxID=1892865 RepID=A0A853A3Z2_9ACTN|nr:DUF6049 family protein [Allostreptomyces psammosilenae]NYI05421.1 hypothetical protein [Allostreptomyces psammosilenae]